MKDDSVTIRIAGEEDAEALLSIYRYYVENTAVTFEYEVPSEEEFRDRIRHTLRTYPYLVAECGPVAERCGERAGSSSPGRDREKREIIGYAYTGPFKGRAAYDWAAETSIYLRHGAARRGIGRKLYAALEEASRRQNIQNLYACISYPDPEDEYLNFGSCRFHEHLGYQYAGRFRKCGYKFGRWYDMVWMEKFIGEHPQKPGPMIPYPETGLPYYSCPAPSSS